MTKEEIIAYIAQTPENINFNILREMLNNIESEVIIDGQKL